MTSPTGEAHIEPFSGDPIRWRSDEVTSGQAFKFLNAGKKSLRLDLRSAEGHSLMLELVAKADVVVENFAPGTAARLGPDWETLHRTNPRVILASGSGYGSSGPNASSPPRAAAYLHRRSPTRT